MKFIETRGNDKQKPKEVEFSFAIKNPSASFGGLYVPKTLPSLDESFFQDNAKSSYKQLAFDILKRFNVDISDEVLQEAVALYDKFDDKYDPVPLVKVKDDLYVNELYHGPTRAFKDMALQPFGLVLSSLAKQDNKNYLILAATSGDTGPAALSTFANKENIKVCCLYPDGGTSDVQRLQMVTQDAPNLKVLGIKGNFDDAQNALKSLLANDEFKQQLKENHFSLSAANSVNFGRIIFQIVYHVSAYLKLLEKEVIKLGEKINIIVPSGNFGNALGAYYAKKMGVAIDKIAIASNENNVLTDLIENGIYDLNNKSLIATNSPAMDILKSSNVERILFDKFGASRTKQLMEDLEKDNCYKLTNHEQKQLKEDFVAFYSDDEFGKQTIRKCANDGYILDPHTATAIKAYESLSNGKDIFVACSTAQWTKFAPNMLSAVNNDNEKHSDIEALNEISSKFNIKIPDDIKEVFHKEVIHKKIIHKEDIQKNIIGFINE
jgi:threonine synthase